MFQRPTVVCKSGVLNKITSDSEQGSAFGKIEGSPVLWICEIQGAQHMISMKKLRFPICPRIKERYQGPLEMAIARQPC